MLVKGEQLDAQLHIEEAAAAELEGRPPRVVKGRTRLPQTAIRMELVGVLVSNRLEGLGADLLLAFDEEAQRDRNRAEPLQRLEGVDPRHDVCLVVGNPP